MSTIDVNAAGAGVSVTVTVESDCENPPRIIPSDGICVPTSGGFIFCWRYEAFGHMEDWTEESCSTEKCKNGKRYKGNVTMKVKLLTITSFSIFAGPSAGSGNWETPLTFWLGPVPFTTHCDCCHTRVDGS